MNDVPRSAEWYMFSLGLVCCSSLLSAFPSCLHLFTQTQI